MFIIIQSRKIIEETPWEVITKNGKQIKMLIKCLLLYSLEKCLKKTSWEVITGKHISDQDRIRKTIR